MKYTATITVQPGQENDEALIRTALIAELAKKQVRIQNRNISALVQVKKSLDARRGRGGIKLHLRYDIYTDGDMPEESDAGAPFEPKWQKVDENAKRVVIVGDGPAGIFAALALLEQGIKPIIVERGAETSARKRIIADISRRGAVDSDTNYCFGEGGAGTFSDGKLFSRSNKRGNIPRALQLFHFHGAVEDILTNAHPHIGTDKLPGIINRMNQTIRDYGGEILFETRCTSLVMEGNRVAGISTGTEVLQADAVILATGHSAPDVYQMVYDVQPAALEAKTFAAGVRVEHPRTIIDAMQYHGKERGDILPPAEYRVTAQASGRGVYSFCMCPGGLVVPSASAPGSIVVNGMSPSDRGGRFSNAAIVVEIRPEDIPAEYAAFPGDPLAGLRFRTAIETSCAAATGNPQAAPAQRLADFMAGAASTTLPDTTYAPGIYSARLDTLLPAHIASHLKEGFAIINHKMKGFICNEALMIAPETRTSTPVRILRDKETWQSPVIAGLYPAGEGAGYAGGIISSALDGENAARAVAAALQK